MGRSGALGTLPLGPVLPDELGYVVVGVDVADRLDDVCWPVAVAASLEDRGFQCGGRLRVGVGRSLKFLAGLRIHASQCLMFLHCGHDLIVHDRFVVW